MDWNQFTPNFLGLLIGVWVFFGVWSQWCLGEAEEITGKQLSVGLWLYSLFILILLGPLAPLVGMLVVLELRYSRSDAGEGSSDNGDDWRKNDDPAPVAPPPDSGSEKPERDANPKRELLSVITPLLKGAF